MAKAILAAMRARHVRVTVQGFGYTRDACLCLQDWPCESDAAVLLAELARVEGERDSYHARFDVSSDQALHMARRADAAESALADALRQRDEAQRIHKEDDAWSRHLVNLIDGWKARADAAEVQVATLTTKLGHAEADLEVVHAEAAELKARLAALEGAERALDRIRMLSKGAPDVWGAIEDVHRIAIEALATLARGGGAG
jgi:chromosome segregation ATPase